MSEVIGRIDVQEKIRFEVDYERIESGQSLAKRELPGRQRLLERRQRRPPVGARERPGLRYGRVLARVGESGQRLPCDPRRVHREHDTQLVLRNSKPGDDTGDRRADVGTVVDQREGKIEPIGSLPDREPLVAERQRFPTDLGERAPLEAGERLR